MKELERALFRIPVYFAFNPGQLMIFDNLKIVSGLAAMGKMKEKNQRKATWSKHVTAHFSAACQSRISPK